MSSSDRLLKLGAPYFNARPLVWQFVEDSPSDLELVEETPSRLTDRLRAGELDAALISSVEAYRDETLEVLPGIGVASRGPVWSIRLFHRGPLESVRAVALDTSSRTSAALARILFAERWNRRPEFVDMPPDLPAMLDRCDAALLIGDPALRSFSPTVPYVDLGEEWFRWTGLPFVFAVWAGRPGVFGDGLGDRLYSALAYGQTRIDAIVAAEAGPRDLDPVVCHEYLSRVIRYRLGPEDDEGVRRFMDRAQAHGIVQANP